MALGAARADAQHRARRKRRAVRAPQASKRRDELGARHEAELENVARNGAERVHDAVEKHGQAARPQRGAQYARRLELGADTRRDGQRVGYAAGAEVPAVVARHAAADLEAEAQAAELAGH